MPESMHLQIQSLRSEQQLDGLTRPPPTMLSKARERRCVLLISSFITHNREIPDADTRMVWGNENLVNGAILLGRLFSTVARIADGFPTTGDGTVVPFSVNCVTFEQLMDTKLYTNGLDHATKYGKCQHNWTMKDEIYAFSRGVEAFLSGLVTVWDELPLVRAREMSVLYIAEICKSKFLSEKESIFRATTGKFDNCGMRITRGAELKSRLSVISAYASFHLHVSSWANRFPLKRPRTDAMDLQDADVMVASEESSGFAEATRTGGCAGRGGGCVESRGVFHKRTNRLQTGR